MSDDEFGPLESRGTVEAAVLALLARKPGGIVWYLAEVERQKGLRVKSLPVPRSEQSFRGGLDFDTFQEDWMPMLTVVAQPLGDPERAGVGEYAQTFEVKLAATVSAQDEDTARELADAYGIAMTALVLQKGSLGIGATKTTLTGSPRLEFVDPTVRRVARAIATFHTTLDVTVTESDGPQVFATDPYQQPGTWPIVTSTPVKLTAEPL